MEVLSVGDIIRACRGTPFNIIKDIFISAISTDTRRVTRGELFIPLRGERFDGHDYIMDAYEKGAELVLTEYDLKLSDKPYIVVENTLIALQEIARYYKNQFSVKLIGITGSSGKTTTKDMIAAVVAEGYKVLKTEGNLNNAIGLPLTLLNLNSQHEAVVLEMGMNSLGEIQKLVEISDPHIGVITNVGTAHIEKLQSRENILKAKMEMFTYFTRENTAIINGDNDLLRTIKNTPYKLMRFGLSRENDIYAYDIAEKGEQGIEFKTDINGSTYKILVPIPGIHNVYNALSAICVGLELNMDMESITSGIQKFKPSKLRMEIFTTSGGVKVINDAYNANPESMCAAIDVLNGFRQQGRTVCVLGDMLELGDMSEQLHKKVGAYISEIGIDVIVTVGKLSKHIAEGAAKNTSYLKNIHIYDSNEEASENISHLIKSGDTVLVKGSRGMKMETIVEFLRERG